MKEIKVVTRADVSIISSTVGLKSELAAKRVLERKVSEDLQRVAFANNLPHGFHYIFKYNAQLENGVETRLHVEVKSEDTSACYAEAKVRQLEQFPDLSHTGGETIGQVREMLRQVAGEDKANAFYPDLDDSVPVVVIDEETAIWLRDTYGIAPWYGGLRIPFDISVFTGDADVKGCFLTGFSGFENDQEDNFYNIFYTRAVLESLAEAWTRDIIRLDLNELRGHPVTSTVLNLVRFDDVVSAKSNLDDD